MYGDPFQLRHPRLRPGIQGGMDSRLRGNDEAVAATGDPQHSSSPAATGDPEGYGFPRSRG